MWAMGNLEWNSSSFKLWTCFRSILRWARITNDSITVHHSHLHCVQASQILAVKKQTTEPVILCVSWYWSLELGYLPNSFHSCHDGSSSVYSNYWEMWWKCWLMLAENWSTVQWKFPRPWLSNWMLHVFVSVWTSVEWVTPQTSEHLALFRTKLIMFEQLVENVLAWHLYR